MLTTSERGWLTVRSYLTEHRYDLAVAATQDYPPDRRVAGTPLLSAPGWLPPAPVPLRDISLELRDAGPAEVEVTTPFLPRRADGTPYRRYSEAMAELAAPQVFENRATYRLTEADLCARPPRLVFAGAGTSTASTPGRRRPTSTPRPGWAGPRPARVRLACGPASATRATCGVARPTWPSAR